MNSSDWNEDIEVILDKIRLNSIIFSNKHTANHLYYMKTSRFFEIPVIVLSVISGSIVSAVGFNQNQSSMASTFISSIITILTSVKLYMKINENIAMEQELSISYKILGLDIFKVLSLPVEQRNVNSSEYLNQKYSEYIKLTESSHILSKITDKDQMMQLPLELKSSNNSLQSESPLPFESDLETPFHD
jgi:hypothetical protein